MRLLRILMLRIPILLELLWRDFPGICNRPLPVR